MKASRSIGILREVKNKWERRVAIVPSEVQKLVNRNIKVLIEPCERRIFKDIDYKNAGAIITNDLSDCSFIIGVKDIESDKLFENHSYLNFAHVIKGQPSNMRFLDECLQKNIRLFDYECIKDCNTKLRTVAFGRFAGLAGMITGMRGLGEHLLAQGCATPFLNMSSTYMYNSLIDAKEQVLKIGEMISKYGLPTNKYGPFVFTFTGGGNVTNGALEIFKLLPHEFINANDLPKLSNNYNSNKVYGCILNTQSIVEHKTDGANFEEKHYFEYPEEYKPIFHSSIAPYTTVLINGMYWDYRYPRLLTIAQISDLQNNNKSMIGLFDISCDPFGAVEFLKKTTNSCDPYFTYNCEFDTINNEIDGDGILVLGVDSLPAELPKDSSEYFSETLYPYLERLATSDCNIDINQQEKDLGSEMFNAMITCHGKLTNNFQYISALRREQKNVKNSNSENIIRNVLKIDGHLFDSGIINQILDMIEINNCEYNILNLHSKVNTRELQKASRLILQIDMMNGNGNDNKMEELINKLNILCELHPKAQAKLIKLPFGATKESIKLNNIQNINPQKNERNENIKPQKNILLFGSGFVSKPVIDYLCMSGNNIITIATNDINSINSNTINNKYCKIIEFDVLKNDIDSLISKHDIIISLLPSNMHIPIAKSCIKYKKDMTTASYISNEMKKLNNLAIKSNIILLNECGLDPGLDHMCSIKMINKYKNEGINSFISYCGGLPSPEHCDNLFGYKFSWSPIGVLNASLNDAKYLYNNKIININNNQLLINGIGTNKLSYFDNNNPYNSLSLEHIANRDSLKYIQKYKLDENILKNMYRGTLRYNGFSNMLYGCKILGLLNDNDIVKVNKGEIWYDYLRRIINHKYKYENDEHSLKYIIEDILIKNSEWENDEIQLFLQCLENDLNIFDKNENIIQKDYKYIINAFCELLQNKLYFNNENNERDMVLMINKIFTNTNKIYESSLLVYGDEHYSAMARTVGFPLAIATQFLLNGDIDKKYKENVGVIDATNVVLSNMILDKCEQFGIKFKNRVITQYNINNDHRNPQKI